MRDKRKPTLARGGSEHDWQLRRGVEICKNCGKADAETCEQEEPAVCWAEVSE